VRQLDEEDHDRYDIKKKRRQDDRGEIEIFSKFH
jgi:hypothetical protein